MYTYIYALPDGTLESAEYESLTYIQELMGLHRSSKIEPVQVNSSDGRLVIEYIPDELDYLTFFINPEFAAAYRNELIERIRFDMDVYYSGGGTDYLNQNSS